MANIIYRSMREDPTGRPACEPSARGLGVRPEVDIPIHNGLVQPQTGGLSVAPDDPRNLSLHRRPAWLGGTGKDPVWSIRLDSLGESLAFRQDRVNHGLIEPAYPMPIKDFDQALCHLAHRWEKL